MFLNYINGLLIFFLLDTVIIFRKNDRYMNPHYLCNFFSYLTESDCKSKNNFCIPFLFLNKCVVSLFSLEKEKKYCLCCFRELDGDVCFE